MIPVLVLDPDGPGHPDPDGDGDPLPAQRDHVRRPGRCNQLRGEHSLLFYFSLSLYLSLTK